MERKQMHIMAIGAHIGDMELTCGKVLAKHAVMGDKITTLAMTAGERGCPPGYTPAEFRKKNIESAAQFAKMLGGESLVMDFPDGEVVESEEIKFKLCDIIREKKADVLITHWKNSIHKDHIVTHKIVVDAHFYAALKTIERQLPSHWAKGPYYSENWEDTMGFDPYVYVDVTEGYELWDKAIRCLWLSTNAQFKYLEYYDALSRSRGCLIGKERAEAFDVDLQSKRQVLTSF